MTKETRTLKLNKKRFARSDLLAIADLISNIAEESKDSRPISTLRFLLHTSDGATYEAEDTVHLREGAEVDLRPVSAVVFEFSARGRSVDLRVSNESYSSNQLRVSGDDRAWVHSTFSRLTERLGAVPPSESWFTRYPRLLFHLCALGVGSLVSAAIGGLLHLTVYYLLPVETRDAFLRTKPPEGFGWWMFYYFTSTYPFRLLWYWLIGTPWAAFIRAWILSGWPPIDLDVGPAHQRRPAMRRARISVFLVGVLLPLFANTIYDIGKFFVQKASEETPAAISESQAKSDRR